MSLSDYVGQYLHTPFPGFGKRKWRGCVTKAHGAHLYICWEDGTETKTRNEKFVREGVAADQVATRRLLRAALKRQNLPDIHVAGSGNEPRRECKGDDERAERARKRASLREDPVALIKNRRSRMKGPKTVEPKRAKPEFITPHSASGSPRRPTCRNRRQAPVLIDLTADDDSDVKNDSQDGESDSQQDLSVVQAPEAKHQTQPPSTAGPKSRGQKRSAPPAPCPAPSETPKRARPATVTDSSDIASNGANRVVLSDSSDPEPLPDSRRRTPGTDIVDASGRRLESKHDHCQRRVGIQAILDEVVLCGSSDSDDMGHRGLNEPLQVERRVGRFRAKKRKTVAMRGTRAPKESELIFVPEEKVANAVPKSDQGDAVDDYDLDRYPSDDDIDVLPALQAVDDESGEAGGDAKETQEVVEKNSEICARLEPVLKEGRKLFSAQMSSLSWMMDFEAAIARKEGGPEPEWLASRPGLRGGILADEVGWGKTLVSLCMIKLGAPTDFKLGDRGKDGALLSRATLVVCPPHLLYQWESEVHKHFRQGAFKVIKIEKVHDLSKIAIEQACDADAVVISTSALHGRHLSVSMRTGCTRSRNPGAIQIFTDASELNGCWVEENVSGQYTMGVNRIYANSSFPTDSDKERLFMHCTSENVWLICRWEKVDNPQVCCSVKHPCFHHDREAFINSRLPSEYKARRRPGMSSYAHHIYDPYDRWGSDSEGFLEDFELERRVLVEEGYRSEDHNDDKPDDFEEKRAKVGKKFDEKYKTIRGKFLRTRKSFRWIRKAVIAYCPTVKHAAKVNREAPYGMLGIDDLDGGSESDDELGYPERLSTRNRRFHDKTIKIKNDFVCGGPDPHRWKLRPGQGFDGKSIRSQTLKCRPSRMLATSRKTMKKWARPAEEHDLAIDSLLSFHHIRWHRIIIDEAHEVFKDPYRDHTSHLRWLLLNRMTTPRGFRWAISATPLANNGQWNALREYIGLDTPATISYHSESWQRRADRRKAKKEAKHRETRQIEERQKLEVAGVIHKATREQGRDGVLPSVEEEVVYTKLHPVEQLLHDLEYKEIGDEGRAATCCTNFSDMWHDHWDGRELRISTALGRVLSMCRKKIDSSVDQIEKLMEKMRKAKRKLTARNRLQSDDNKETSSYEMRQLDKKMEDVVEKKKAWERRIKYIKRNRAKAERDAKTWEDAHDAVTRDLVDHRGTKLSISMSFVRNIIKRQPKAKIVLFSLEMRALNNAHSVLKKYGIKCAVLQGTASQRKRIMASFQQQYCAGGGYVTSNAFQVLLLSTRWAASGADLHMGTHVFLLDPFGGSASEAYAAEKQAIGRTLRQASGKSKCKVMRFVTKGTIEEERYERNLRKMASEKKREQASEESRQQPPEKSDEEESSPRRTIQSRLEEVLDRLYGFLM